MNNECRIIGDLLPLYAEDMVSEETKEFVSEHLEKCENCRAALKELTAADISPEIYAAPLKDVKKKLCVKRLKSVALAALIVLIIAVSVFSYLTAPHYIPYDAADVTVSVTQFSQSEAGSDIPSRLQIEFSDKATACSIEKFAADGTDCYTMSVWYTLWDKHFGGNGNTSCVVEYGSSDKLAVWYAQNNGKEDVLIFNVNYEDNGGMITLPRLVAGYYALISLALAVIFAVLWFAFRRKNAGKAFKMLFFVPVSYLCGSFAVQGADFVSYSATRNFVLSVIAAVLVYCAVLLIMSLRDGKNESE